MSQATIKLPNDFFIYCLWTSVFLFQLLHYLILVFKFLLHSTFLRILIPVYVKCLFLPRYMFMVLIACASLCSSVTMQSQVALNTHYEGCVEACK